MKIKYASRICTSFLYSLLICFIGVYRGVQSHVTQILPMLILKTAYFEITKAAASLDLSGTDKYT